jgi:hypothetical protein
VTLIILLVNFMYNNIYLFQFSNNEYIDPEFKKLLNSTDEIEVNNRKLMRLFLHVYGTELTLG